MWRKFWRRPLSETSAGDVVFRMVLGDGLGFDRQSGVVEQVDGAVCRIMIVESEDEDIVGNTLFALYESNPGRMQAFSWSPDPVAWTYWTSFARITLTLAVFAALVGGVVGVFVGACRAVAGVLS